MLITPDRPPGQRREAGSAPTVLDRERREAWATAGAVSGAALPLLRPRGRRGGSDRPSVHRASAGLQPRGVAAAVAQVPSRAVAR
jgi:hypothetical protein